MLIVQVQNTEHSMRTITLKSYLIRPEACSTPLTSEQNSGSEVKHYGKVMIWLTKPAILFQYEEANSIEIWNTKTYIFPCSVNSMQHKHCSILAKLQVGLVYELAS